jgi:hypothetical protein
VLVSGRASGGRRYVAAALTGTRPEPAAARPRGFFLSLVAAVDGNFRIPTNGRRENIESNALPSAVCSNAAAIAAVPVRPGLSVAVRPIIATETSCTIAIAAVGTVATVGALTTVRTLNALCTLTRPALGTILVVAVGLRVHLGIAHLVVEIFVIAVVATLAALLFEAGAAFAEHTIIMVGELQVIFRLNPVAGELCVARHALVFFEELGGIAALAIVLAIARLAADVLRPLSPATTTPAALTIVDQIHFLQQKPAPWPFGQARRRMCARPQSLSSRQRLTSAQRTADCIGGGAGSAFPRIGSKRPRSCWQM